MVMLESVVAQLYKTGETIPGKVCCSILVALRVPVSVITQKYVNTFWT